MDLRSLRIAPALRCLQPGVYMVLKNLVCGKWMAFFGILRAMGTQRAHHSLSTTYTSTYARSLNMISGILFY